VEDRVCNQEREGMKETKKEVNRRLGISESTISGFTVMQLGRSRLEIRKLIVLKRSRAQIKMYDNVWR